MYVEEFGSRGISDISLLLQVGFCGVAAHVKLAGPDSNWTYKCSVGFEPTSTRVSSEQCGAQSKRQLSIQQPSTDQRQAHQQ